MGHDASVRVGDPKKALCKRQGMLSAERRMHRQRGLPRLLLEFALTTVWAVVILSITQDLAQQSHDAIRRHLVLPCGDNPWPQIMWDSNRRGAAAAVLAGLGVR